MGSVTKFAGTNIGNAKLAGLLPGLDISTISLGYNIALAIFFVSYSLLEPLTNAVLVHFRPSIFLPVIMVLCGIVMTTMGLVHNLAGLLVTRFFVGLTSAGLFPAANYILSCWYKRSELGVRSAVFFSAAAISGSFGGLLAAGIQKMDGLGGKGGWAWIFIIEGITTIVVGVGSFWMVYDFPKDSKFLTPIERARVLQRLKADIPSSGEQEKFKVEYFWEVLEDWKTWTSIIIYMGCSGPLFAFALFLPTIIADLSPYSPTLIQLLSVPPYAVATVLTVVIGHIADKTHQHGLCNIGVSLLGIVGFSMLLAAKSPSVQYAGTYLGAMGIYPCIPNTITWLSNNTEGMYKRGICIGLVIGSGNLTGILSSFVYRQSDSPRYTLGHCVVLAFMVVFLLGGSILQRILLKRDNTKRISGADIHRVEEGTVETSYSNAE